MEWLKFYAYKGDWEAAKNIIDRDLNLKKEVTSMDLSDILDNAQAAGQWEFFNEVLQLNTNVQTLTTRFAEGWTMLHRVVNDRGSMKSAKALVESVHL